MEIESDILSEIAVFIASHGDTEGKQSNAGVNSEESSLLNEEGMVSPFPVIEELLNVSDTSTLLLETSVEPRILSSATATVVDNNKKKTDIILPNQLIKQCRDKNAHRARVKRELAYLRQKVAELEMKLHMLHSGVMYTEDSCSSRALESSVWKAIAERQLLGRRLAEAENEQLRCVTNTQRQLVVQLQRNLQERWPEESLALSSSIIPQPKHFTDEDTALFHHFAGELDFLYAQSDPVLDATGLSIQTDKMRRINLVDSGDDTAWQPIELIDVDVIPFNVQRVGRAMWQSMLLHDRKLGRLHYHHIPKPKDTVAVKYRVQCNAFSSLTCKCVLRKYYDKQRHIVVWRMLSEGEGELEGMLVDETGWGELVDDPSCQGQCSLLKSYVRMVPLLANTKKNGAPLPDIEKFRGLYMTSCDEDAFAMSCIMENLLLEESMAIERK